MDRVKYSKKKMDTVWERVQDLLRIVAELEAAFPGRHFTLDGHLVGSIGEVLAEYYYGIELYKASAPKHDGEVDGRKVQIKITQSDSIVISAKQGAPDYLLVLYMAKAGNVYEVYNGPGAEPWKLSSKADSHGNKHVTINTLMRCDKNVCDEERIKPVQTIQKMKKEYKNPKTKSQTNK